MSFSLDDEEEKKKSPSRLKLCLSPTRKMKDKTIDVIHEEGHFERAHSNDGFPGLFVSSPSKENAGLLQEDISFYPPLTTKPIDSSPPTSFVPLSTTSENVVSNNEVEEKEEFTFTDVPKTPARVVQRLADDDDEDEEKYAFGVDKSAHVLDESAASEQQQISFGFASREKIE